MCITKLRRASKGSSNLIPDKFAVEAFKNGSTVITIQDKVLYVALQSAFDAFDAKISCSINQLINHQRGLKLTYAQTS